MMTMFGLANVLASTSQFVSELNVSRLDNTQTNFRYETYVTFISVNEIYFSYTRNREVDTGDQCSRTINESSDISGKAGGLHLNITQTAEVTKKNSLCYLLSIK
jgi:hypothetical protein